MLVGALVHRADALHRLRHRRRVSAVRRYPRSPGVADLALSSQHEASSPLQSHVTVELRAVGMVVNVATAEDLAALREQAPDLELRPIPGDDLAARLGLTHYPVLVTPTRLEQ